MCVYVCVFASDNTSSLSWYSPSRRQILRQPESSLPGHYQDPKSSLSSHYEVSSHYQDYDYACAYGDRLPAPSPVYGRHGYVRSSLGNQCDWYGRVDGDGHYEPERYQDNVQVPDVRSPYRQYDESVNRSHDAVGSYYDEDGRYLDTRSHGYIATTTSRLPEGQSRRNGGIGFDWTSTGAPDRKSAYSDDSMLIIAESGEFYSGDDRPPLDYNTGTVQRRAGKTSTSPYHDDPRAVDGLERRLPVGTESVSESAYRKEKDRVQRDSSYRAAMTTSATTGSKNGTQGRSRTKVDDIKRLTERDRATAVQNRKQQNHVTSRNERVPATTKTEESTKPSRGRAHKSTMPTTPVSTTSGSGKSILSTT